VCFDHALEDILNGDVLALAREMVRDGEDCPQVVGRVAPWNGRHWGNTSGNGGKDPAERTFCSEEAVVEVKPTNDGADVEGSTDRVELVVRPRHLGP
jgi:hypothetical protein